MQARLSRARVGVLAALSLALILGSWFAGREVVRWLAPSIVGSASSATPSSVPTAGRESESDGIVSRRSVHPVAPPIRGVSVLTLQLEGVRPLPTGHYEGWAIFANERISTGKFNVNADGALQSITGAAILAFPLTRDIATAERIVITIEPEGDRDSVPSGVVFLEGALARGRAQLVFPLVREPLAGAVTMMTPTDGDSSNEAAGAWFYDARTRDSTLRLPDLPPGWVFEGWVGTQGLTFSMGRFTRAVGGDAAASFSGTRPGLPTPGEDLVARLPGAVRPPINLADGASTIAISLEPDIAGQDPTGPAPSGLILLRLPVPRGTLARTLLPLEVDPGPPPSGVATVG